MELVEVRVNLARTPYGIDQKEIIIIIIIMRYFISFKDMNIFWMYKKMNLFYENL